MVVSGRCMPASTRMPSPRVHSNARNALLATNSVLPGALGAIGFMTAKHPLPRHRHSASWPAIKVVVTISKTVGWDATQPI